MNPQEYARMHALETNYWWFVGRRAIIERLLREKVAQKGEKAPRLLDIGCGTGANLPMLCESLGPNGRACGLDFSPLALQFACARLTAPNLTLSQGDALQLPLRDGLFDIVTMLDVLEHLSDDAKALKEVHRVLRPGGSLILSVPAYHHLWSAHDEALHHFRRYEKANLAKTLRAGGFHIEKISFAMSLMPPLAWFWRRFILPAKPNRPRDAKRHSQGAVLPAAPPWINELLVKYVAIEGQIIACRPLKFGTSLVAVARRR